MNVEIRPATTDDELAVRRLLDGAMLETGDITGQIAADTVLVAVDSADRVHGTLVFESRGRGVHITAIAVRRTRRDQGIGTALVEAVARVSGTVTATFDDRVRPFYQSLGFECEALDAERWRGVRSPER